MITVIIPKHYASFSTIEDVEEVYSLKAKTLSSGDIEVTGDPQNVESFVNDLTMGDQDAMDEILGPSDD